MLSLKSQIESKLGEWCGYNDHFFIKEDNSIENAIPKEEFTNAVKAMKYEFPQVPEKEIIDIVSKFII